MEQGDNKLMLFELDEPEMIKIEEIVLPSKEEEAEGKTVKQMIYIFPPEWAGTFEQPITSMHRLAFAAGALCRKLGCTPAGSRN